MTYKNTGKTIKFLRRTNQAMSDHDDLYNTQPLDDEDQELWDYVTGSITPIEKDVSFVDEMERLQGFCRTDKSKTRPRKTDTPDANTDTDIEAGDDFATLLDADTRKQDSARTPPKTENLNNPGLDRNTEQRLKRGKLPIEARLDLHGMSRDNAHEAVINFITSAHNQGKRCVLIITGKGSRKDADPFAATKPGILKKSLPDWLFSAPLQGKVLRYVAARPQHGGGGAFYVLIRRKR